MFSDVARHQIKYPTFLFLWATKSFLGDPSPVDFAYPNLPIDDSLAESVIYTLLYTIIDTLWDPIRISNDMQTNKGPLIHDLYKTLGSRVVPIPSSPRCACTLSLIHLSRPGWQITCVAAGYTCWLNVCASDALPKFCFRWGWTTKELVKGRCGDCSFRNGQIDTFRNEWEDSITTRNFRWSLLVLILFLPILLTTHLLNFTTYLCPQQNSFTAYL